MVEAGVSAALALITGGFVAFNRVSSRIADVDRRVDGVELRVAQYYVSKHDLETTMNKLEGRMSRIETKLDAILTNTTPH